MGNQPSRQRQRPGGQPAGPPQYPPPAIYNSTQPGPPPFHPAQPPPHDPYLQGWRPTFPPPNPHYPVQSFGPPRGAPAQHPPAGLRPPPAGPPPPPVQVVPGQHFDQTRTIRNAVNLHKKTLRLVPLEGQPHKLRITFSFDATDSCIVSTFAVASEDENNGNRLKPSKQPAAPCIAYSPGLKLPFPKPDAPGADAHVIDTSLFVEAELMATQTADLAAGREGRPLTTYPLIIRMECLGAEAAKEGRSLAKVKPGAPQQPWIQSQTTFATLYKDETGAWAVKPLKQKLLVDTTNYEIQDIYGLEQGQVAPEERSEEENEDRLCVICLVNERNTTVLPCRHMCMCDECAQELRKQTHKCPICRIHVESLLHIKSYAGDNKTNNEAGQQKAAAGSAANPPSPGAVAVAAAGPGTSRGAMLMAK